MTDIIRGFTDKPAKPFVDDDGRMLSRWFDFDSDKEEWSFALTEQYVWSRSHESAKPIGDMTREELVQALAVTKHDLDEMALAFVAWMETHKSSAVVDKARRLSREVYELAPGGFLI
jgi:hypothetical protein